MIIVHIITGLYNGGAEAVLYRLITGDKKNTHHIISLIDLGYYGDRLMAADISVYTLNMPRSRMTFKGLYKLYSLIYLIKPDVVQTWMYHADFIGGLIAHVAGVHTVVWGVHSSNLDSDKFSIATRLVARLCRATSGLLPKRIVCCSTAALNFHSLFGYCHKKLVVVPNGINLVEFKPDDSLRESVRIEIGINSKEVLIGMVGRWDPIKDHANFIAALEKLCTFSTKAWRCVLVGTDINNENLDLVKLLKKHHVVDRVKLIGPRSDIPAVMNALDLHVLPSFGESFGNVTVEAMACGVPAVVTSVGEGELIVGNTGWVVPPADPMALAAAINKAFYEMSDSHKWSSRKIACRSRVVEKFSLEIMVNGYLKVWNDILGNC